jgi:hypothetical protein
MPVLMKVTSSCTDFDCLLRLLDFTDTPPTDPSAMAAKATTGQSSEMTTKKFLKIGKNMEKDGGAEECLVKCLKTPQYLVRSTRILNIIESEPSKEKKASEITSPESIGSVSDGKAFEDDLTVLPESIRSLSNGNFELGKLHTYP